MKGREDKKWKETEMVSENKGVRKRERWEEKKKRQHIYLKILNMIKGTKMNITSWKINNTNYFTISILKMKGNQNI